MKTSIVIPTMTFKFTQICVDSIIAHTSLDDLEIIIVANGAGTELWDYANDLSGKGYPVSILWYPEPLGPVPALNAGIREAKGDFILLLNDEGFMGRHVNTRWQNVVNWSIVTGIIIISTLFAISTMFPRLFGGS